MAELANRMEQEADFAKRLSRLSSRHRKELIALLGTPPDISRVPQDFWIRVEKEHREELGIILALLFVAASDQHIDLLLPGDLRYVAMDTVQDKADTWADSRSRSLSRKYVENSRKGLVRADRKWYGTGPRVLGPTAPEVPTPEVYEQVVDIFGPERDARLASTETTRAATAGTKEATEAAKDLGVVTTITWYTEGDARVCPICAPLHRVEMQDWESVGINAEISSNGGPPAHENCRCWLEIKRVKNIPESVLI